MVGWDGIASAGLFVFFKLVVDCAAWRPDGMSLSHLPRCGRWDTVDEFTLDEIMNGKPDNFPGLIPGQGFASGSVVVLNRRVCSTFSSQPASQHAALGRQSTVLTVERGPGKTVWLAGGRPPPPPSLSPYHPPLPFFQGANF